MTINKFKEIVNELKTPEKVWIDDNDIVAVYANGDRTKVVFVANTAILIKSTYIPLGEQD